MTETTAPSRIKLQYLFASEMSLSDHISPFKAPSIKKDSGREEARAAPRLVLDLEESRAGKDQHMNCTQLVESIHAQKNTWHGDILNLLIHGSLSKVAFLYRSQNKNWTMPRKSTVDFQSSYKDHWNTFLFFRCCAFKYPTIFYFGSHIFRRLWLFWLHCQKTVTNSYLFLKYIP